MDPISCCGNARTLVRLSFAARKKCCSGKENIATVFQFNQSANVTILCSINIQQVLHLKRKHWHSLIQSSANNKYFWQFWLLFFTYLSPPYQKFPVIYPIHKEHICIDGVMQLLAVYLSLLVEPLLYCSRGASIIHCTLARCIVFIILYKYKILLCKGIS